MIQLALGTTVLQRGLQQNSLDGIGVYTQALLATLFSHPELSIQEVVFPGRSFYKKVIYSAFLGVPFPEEKKLQNVRLYHATDHFIPKFRKIPVVATLMDPVPLMRPDWVSMRGRKLKNWLFRQSAHWASHYITISQSVIPDLVEYFRISAEKITPIHLGVHVQDFAPVSSEKKREVLEKFKLKENGLLFIGTLQPRKNVGRIIAAFESLPHELQQTFPLVIVGREGWSCQEELKKLHQLIEKGVAYWLKYVSSADKVVLLQTARALVFPSLYEGFGLPVLEAFASHLPVITSNTSSLPEIAEGAAYLVNPLDIEELSQAMRKIIEQPEHAKSLVEKGYERASQMTWERCAEKTLDVYKNYI